MRREQLGRRARTRSGDQQPVVRRAAAQQQTGPGRVRLLQRTIGNAAVARLLGVQRITAEDLDLAFGSGASQPTSLPTTTTSTLPSDKLIDVEDAPPPGTGQPTLSVDELMDLAVEQTPTETGEATEETRTEGTKKKKRRERRPRGGGGETGGVTSSPYGSLFALASGSGVGVRRPETTEPEARPRAPENPRNTGEARLHLLEHVADLTAEPGPHGDIVRTTLSDRRRGEGTSWAKFTWGLAGFELHVHYLGNGAINTREVKVVRASGGGESFLGTEELAQVRAYVNIHRS